MTKLEEVARGIARRLASADNKVSVFALGGPPLSGRALEIFVDLNWRHCLGVADAAIAAMREPSEEMLAAAEKALDAREDIAGIYGAMIDAVLKDGK